MKTSNLCLSWLVVFLFAACQSDVAIEMADCEQLPIVEEQAEGYTTQVSVADVMHLAGVFNAGKATTKADARTVKDVTTLTDDAGNPSIYVVNYVDNGGFVLVSATKNYHPILAFNDEGNFKLPDTGSGGISWWLEKTKWDIRNADELPTDSVLHFRSEWKRYEKSQVSSRGASTRFTGLDTYVFQLIDEWVANDIPYWSLDEADSVLPADVYQSWCALAEGGMFPTLSESYDYMTYSFVIMRTNDRSSSVPNMVQTTWNQENGYNQFIPKINGLLPPVGCGAVAMAQIMKYHEYPTNENWSDMPDTTATETTARFMYKVAESIHTVYGIDGSGSDFDHTVTALRDTFGYRSTIEQIDHSATRVKTELDNERPVMMRATTSTGGGHAWICTGYSFLDFDTEYQLIVASLNDGSSTSPYAAIDTYGKTYYNSERFYVNWGDDEGTDGYYIDSDLKRVIPSSGNTVTYNLVRKDIVGIDKPN